MSSWIQKNLFISDGEVPYYQPEASALFERRTVLYSTRLGYSFIDTLMSGVGRKSSFDYRKLQQTLAKLPGASDATIFYVVDPDNCMSCLSSTEKFNFDYELIHRLDIFEQQPAEEGGNSYLGLLSGSNAWLLSHRYCPCNDFTVEFYSSDKLGQDLLNSLEIQEVEDLG